MKALVVRLSSIGDVVHTLPTLAALRQHGWEAGWIVEPPGRVLLEGNPALEQVVATPAARAFRWSEARSAVRALRRRRYDVALEFQGLWKSAVWARLAGARRVVGFARPWRREPASALLVGEQAELPAGREHVIDKNLSLLGPLGIEATGLREFPLPFSEEIAARVAGGLRDLSVADFVVLNPAGGWESKLWPAERFGELAQGLRQRGLSTVVTWGPGEEDLADRVVASSDGAAVRSLPTTLLDYVELARRARLVVAADTGPLHLACAVATPVVALFGPTDPARNGPFDPSDEVVRRTPACAPCYSRACQRHAGIMAEIPVAEVLNAAVRRLASAREQESHAVQV
jgi:lipopolysaccharide heptosyltransferase I